MATWTWPWRRTMREKERWIGPTGFRRTGKRGITCSGCRMRITGRARDASTICMSERILSIAKWTPTDGLFSRTSEAKRAVRFGGSNRGMSLGQKNFHKLFAGASLGFALLGWSVLPCPAAAATTRSSVKREAAGSQFTRAEEQRAALNAKAPEKRTLAEYKQVVASYRRVYLITPHAAEVPDALFAVGELNTEMGDHFGRSYYQAAVDSYSFLIREYPASRYVQDAMLRAAQLQKAQLGDSAAATKSFQDFQKKFPRSTHKREVQEALAELALMRNAEAGDLAAKNRAPASSPDAVFVAAPKSEAAGPPARKATSGG